MGNRQSRRIPVEVECKKFDKNYDKKYAKTEEKYACSLSILYSYSEQETVGDVLKAVELRVCEEFEPVRFRVEAIEKDSFVGKYIGPTRKHDGQKDLDEIRGKRLRAYEESAIRAKGLHVCVAVNFHHLPSQALITCPAMMARSSSRATDCDIPCLLI